MAVADSPSTRLPQWKINIFENWLKHDKTGAREHDFVLSTSLGGGCGAEEFKHHSVQETVLDLHLQQINQH